MKYELELSSGKTIIARKPTIRDQRLALQAASTQSTSPVVVQSLVLQELIKLIVVEVNGKKLDATTKEAMDSWLDLAEMAELQMGLEEVLGGIPKAPKVKVITSAAEATT